MLVKKIVLLSLVLLFVCASGLKAQLDRSIRPEPTEPPKVSIGDYKSFTLKNGLKVIVVPNDKLPRVAVSIILDHDPVLEREFKGYTKLMGDMLKEGTKNRSRDSLNEAIDFLGARIFTSSNSIYGTALSEFKEDLFELVSDVIQNPSFDEEALERLKRQAISELTAQKDDPNQIASWVRRSLIFGKDHPYGEVATEKTIENINIDICREHFETYFKPNVAYMAVVGDVSFREAKKLVRKYFDKWEKADVPKHEYDMPVPPAQNHIAIVDRPNAVQTQIDIAYPLPLYIGHEDDIKARLMNIILGGGSFRLYDNLREKHAYTYGAYSIISFDKLAGNFNAFASVRTEVTDSAIVQFLYELNRIRNEKISATELQLIKNYISGNFAISLEDPQTLARYALNIQRHGLPDDYYANYLRKVGEVSKEDIQNAALKYIKPDNAYIITVGNASEYKDKLGRFSTSAELYYYDIFGNPVDPSAFDIPDGLTAEKVLENYIKAIGGKEKLQNLRSVSLDIIANVQGMEISINQTLLAPNKMLQLAKMGDMVLSKTVFDGEKGLMEQQGMQEIIDEEDELFNLKFQATMNSELKLDEFDITPKIHGGQNIDGVDCYIVKLDMPNGKSILQYYEVETGLKAQETIAFDTPQGEMVQTTKFSNYIEQDGLLFPTELTQSMGPQVLNMKVKEIRLNEDIDEALFEIN